ncbi:hypothetical protein A3K63_01195 [Candidatus Micrarchaeota archaeon RBG_16_49_10]|nr:MAG: hypothetical protein A3K63_01195 [Candidatus Micrarchaeota archaeon RBG_16_49_10]
MASVVKAAWELTIEDARHSCSHPPAELNRSPKDIRKKSKALETAIKYVENSGLPEDLGQLYDDLKRYEAESFKGILPKIDLGLAVDAFYFLRASLGVVPQMECYRMYRRNPTPEEFQRFTEGDGILNYKMIRARENRL